MKSSVGWGPAVLAALLQVHHICYGGAVSVHRKKQPVSDVQNLRSALEARTEELQNQKNVAHGLQLEVRELQSELQAEKKALAVEMEKEHSMQSKLNRVRAVLDDGAETAPNSKVAKAEKGTSAPAALPSAISDVDAGTKFTSQPVEESIEPLANVADTELEPPAEEMVAPKPRQQMQQTQQLPPPPLEEPVPVVHARQTTPQEPPPFFEAAALQSSTATKAVPVKPAEKAVVQVKPKAPKSHSAKGAHAATPAHKVAKAVPAKTAARSQKAKHPVAFRGSKSAASKPAAPPPPSAPPASSPKTLSEAVTSAASLASPAFAANTAAVAKDGSQPAASSADFDALEAQLHEEDRRIQDLDRENALDTMSDGGLPPVAGSQPLGNSAPLKAMPAQPKLELDAEAPMEDFLNVEAPGPDSSAEAGSVPSAPAISQDASSADPLAQEGGLEAAQSDNQFLAQIAPSSGHN